MKRREPGTDDRRLALALVRWFQQAARDLPWRVPDPGTGRRDPYRSLVSEVMLQQTQVARVIERFGPFLDRFPTIAALAKAPESDVLAAWSGMGYYRRARMLHRAARAIMDEHAGRVPDEPGALAALPGIGRYTAGAIASICFGRAEPIVDGNVRRVLMRLAARRGAQSGPVTDRWAWARAADLVSAAAGLRPAAPGELNESLMELGATVCTPRNPRCEKCPARSECLAKARGLQDRIPLPNIRAERSVLHCASVVVADSQGHLLVERRGDAGLWAGMWQAPTFEAAREPTLSQVIEAIGAVSPGRVVQRFNHGLTHRDVRFSVRRACVSDPIAQRLAGGRADRRWVRPGEAAAMALSNPQRRILLEIGPGRSSLSPHGVS